MKKVIILQKYLTPYRIPLFNQISNHPEIDLILFYYGTIEERRKWKKFGAKEFKEFQCKGISIASGFEGNIEIPYKLFSDLLRKRPNFIICAPDIGGIVSYLYKHTCSAKYIIWSEATPVTETKGSKMKLAFRRILYDKASAIIVPGKLAETYIRRFLEKPKIYEARNTIEEQRFQLNQDQIMNKFRDDKLTFTFSGSLVERKGVHLLLTVFKRLFDRHPSLRDSCELQMLGTGPLDISEYQDSAIHIRGFCDGDTYASRMKSSHVFVLPSQHDCNPLTIIEALYAGNIIIASDGVGNYPEAVNGNGFVFKSGDAEQLRKILEHLIQLSKTEQQAMALSSRLIADDFATRRSADGFIRAILN